MFDDQPVHRTMERIFTPLESAGTAPPVPPRVRAPEAPAPRRRWFMGKDGIAAVGFALTVTALGMVMVPLLSPAARPPSVLPVAATAPMVARVPAAVPAPPPVLPQPAPIPTPAAPVAAAPVVATPASPVAATPRPRAATIRTRTVRRQRARPRPSRYRRREAPRLAGAALRRALARDVVITRRLNQQALRRLRGR